jgi:arylsulfatase A-like enzyme
VVVAAIVAASASCLWRVPDREVEIDLLSLFAFTEAGQEVDAIDFGTPEAGAHLPAGWSAPDRLPSGQSVAWGVARRSAVRFALREPAERRLLVRCGVPGATHRPMTVVGVDLNGHPLTSLRLGTALDEQVVPLPAEFQRAGLNELEFSNRLLLPDHAGARAGRSDAMACDHLAFETVDGSRASRVVRTGDAVILPASRHLDYFLRVPSAGALVFALPPAGTSASELRVSLRRQLGEERELFRGASSGSPVRVDLTSFGGELAEISFAVTGEGQVRVVAPRIVGRAPSEPAGSTSARQTPRPNVLLYVVDTLRADHLGCYGYAADTSPHIDALAAESVVFTQAIAQASWTTPATASIMTGRDPTGHGVTRLGQGIRSDVPTLAEVLRGEGYRTGGFVTSANVMGELGFGRGFEEYRYFPERNTRPSMQLPADELHAHVLPWLHRRDDRPFFLYVHATDPHAPYLAPARLRERFHAPDGGSPPEEAAALLPLLRKDPSQRTPDNLARLVSLYDAEIAFVDENFGSLVRELTRLGLWDRTLVVLVADHGEELHDHGGFEHGHALYEEQTRIPLIARLPGGRGGGRRLSSLARQVDIAPTILAQLGVSPPAGMHGRSLPLDGEGGWPVREAFTQTTLGGVERSAVVTGAWKVISGAARDPVGFEVYDLRTDPEERDDLAARAPVVLGYGKQLLAEWTTSAPRRQHDGEDGIEQPAMSPEARKRLEALGYVN